MAEPAETSTSLFKSIAKSASEPKPSSSPAQAQKQDPKAEASSEPKPEPKQKSAEPPLPPTPKDTAKPEPEAEPEPDSEPKSRTEPQGDEPEPKKQKAPKGDELEQIYRFKADGQDVEISARQLIQRYQIDQAARNRLREATETTKRAGAVLEQIKVNPLNTAFELRAREYGDPRRAQEEIVKLALDYLKPMIQEHSMPEDQRAIAVERRSLDWERKRMEEARQSEAQRQHEEAISRQREKVISEIRSEIGNAKMNGAPIEIIQQRVIETILDHDAQGIQLTIPDAVNMVKERFDAQAREYFSKLKPSELKKLNPEAYENLRLSSIEAAKEKRSTTNATAASQADETTADDKRRSRAKEASLRDTFDEIERQASKR